MGMGEQQSKRDILEERLTLLLPERYRNELESIRPVSMGSAALKFASDGRVAWDLIWGSFCDLAMAGGPPHRGTLLEPGGVSEIDERRDRYEQIAQEICRAITLVTRLEAEPSPHAGWVRVECTSFGMTRWLLRAITTENISARSHGAILELPAGPLYRLEKEVKNVVTAIAKTCHYWREHMDRNQQTVVSRTLETMQREAKAIEPASEASDDRHTPWMLESRAIADALSRATGLVPAVQAYRGWAGVDLSSEDRAIWMMRMLVAGNVLARREGTILFVPVNPLTDPAGKSVVQSFASIHGYAEAKSDW